MWNLLYASLLAGGIATSSGVAAPESDYAHQPVSSAELKTIPDRAGMEMIQKLLPGAHRHYFNGTSRDIFDAAVEVECLDAQRAIVLESEGNKNRIYFSRIQQMVTTHYTPPGRTSPISLLLFNYQNILRERYQFIVEEKRTGDLELVAHIITEFRRRDSEGIPCGKNTSKPGSAAILPELTPLPPPFAVSLSEIEDLCAGKIAILSGRIVDHIGTIDFAECTYEPAEENLTQHYKTIKDKYTPAARAMVVICGNSTQPTAQRCDSTAADFGNEALAYRRAKYTTLKLEEMLGDKRGFAIIPYGNGIALNRRTIDLYLIQENKK